MKNKKKVIFIAPNLGKGGAERVLSTLLINLDRKKYKIKSIFYEVWYEYPIPNDVKTYHLNLPGTNKITKKIIRFIIRISKMKKILEYENPDLVVSFLNKVNLAVIIAVILCNNTKTKLIISERNSPSMQFKDIKGFIIKLLMKILYPFAYKIIAVSEGVKNDLIKNFHCSKGKIQVIYNPIPIKNINLLAKEEINESPWFYEDIPIIINVASLTNQKGQDYLLRAFKMVREMTHVRLVFLGRGEKEHVLKNLVRQLGIKKDVLFLGFQKNPYKFMAKSKIFVLSSLWEGFPVALLEAMACGIPVIATDCPSGPNEIIEDYKNGFLVPVREEKAISDRILKILNNKDLTDKIKSNELKDIKKFDVKSIIKKYEDILC